MLIDVGGGTVEEFVKRTMRFLLSATLARQFNVSGRGKRSFASLEIFDILFRKHQYCQLTIIALFVADALKSLNLKTMPPQFRPSIRLLIKEGYIYLFYE